MAKIQLVTNSKDPSGMGMFSKTGRFTNELYSVFQKKNEILHDQPKYLKVSVFPSLAVSY